MRIKKIISLILAAAMLAGIFAVSVSADEYVAFIDEIGYTDIKEAVSAAMAKPGSTIMLCGDAELDATLMITRALTITTDGGNYTISRASGFSGNMFSVSDNLTLKTDSDIGGSITLNGVGGASDPMIRVSGGVLKTEGSIMLTGNSSAVEGGSAVYLVDGARFNFYGGSIASNTCTGYGNAVYVADFDSTLSIGANASVAEDSDIYVPANGYIELASYISGTSVFTLNFETLYEGSLVAGGEFVSEADASHFKVFSGGKKYSTYVEGAFIKALAVEDSGDVPSAVAKIGDKEYSSLADAFADIAEGNEAAVVLCKKAVIDSTLKIGGNRKITLVSAGDNVITRGQGFTGNMFTVEQGSSLCFGANGSGSIMVNGEGISAAAPCIINYGSLTVNGGVTFSNHINNNRPEYNGVIYLANGSFTMNGGSVSGNNVSYGPINVNGGNFVMNGGEIKNNTAVDGGGVYYVGGSFAMNGGMISDNFARFGENVWAAKDFTISGNAIITGKETAGHVYLSGSNKIVVKADWNPAMPQGYSGIVGIGAADMTLYRVVAVFEGEPKENMFAVGTDTEGEYLLRLQGKELIIASGDDSLVVYYNNKGYETLEDAFKQIPDGATATIMLTGDVEVKSTIIIKEGQTVTLAANTNLSTMEDYTQRTIKRAAEFKEAIFSVEKGATFTISAPEGKSLVIDGEGKAVNRSAVLTNGVFTLAPGAVIKANLNKANEKLGAQAVYSYGGGVYVEENGVLTLGGGQISGCYASFGGGVYVKDGGMIITDGAVTENEARFGGGVYLSSTKPFEEDKPEEELIRADLVMTGGSITSNKATAYEGMKNTGYGGGVYISNGSLFGISAGSISKNTAVVAAGVCVGATQSTDNEVINEPSFIMSDKADIASDNDVYLAVFGVSYIKVTKALEKADVVITIPKTMLQNMQLVKFEVSDKQEDNELAAKTAFEKGMFKLDKDAQKLFTVQLGGTDKSILRNTIADSDFAGFGVGREYNGFDKTEEVMPEEVPEGEEAESITQNIVYDRITVGTDGVFSADYEFTYYPSLYSEMEYTVSAPFLKGTALTMIDLSDPENTGYYYYEVTGEEAVLEEGKAVEGIMVDGNPLSTPNIIEIPLASFIKMGTLDELYEVIKPALEANTAYTSRYIFVVDLHNVSYDDSATEPCADFTMSFNNYVKGSFEGEKYNISAAAPQTLYTVSKAKTSTVNIAGDKNKVNVSYQLTEDSLAYTEGAGVIMIQASENFPYGTAFVDENGKHYLAAKDSNVVIIPLSAGKDGMLKETGEYNFKVVNYYNTAIEKATLRAVICVSDDGKHCSVGVGYDAESEGTAISVAAEDRFAVLVTTPDGNGKPYYEYFEQIEKLKSLDMVVKGMYNSTEINSFTIALRKANRKGEYEECELSELFKMPEGKLEDTMNTGSIKLALKDNPAALIGNEYQIVFKVGDAVEYVKINMVRKEK